jgi:hypothetical protein
MSHAIRITDAERDPPVCVVCGSSAAPSELQIVGDNPQPVVTVLCRRCLTQLAHTVTGRLVYLDRSRVTGDDG